ncbi:MULTISPECIES: rod shape-determining protein MreC [unclassified Halanaerobium]|uniref:rod shape-determining protein MreC n=1 Tax=unclassified Halanaerobium TaxID=2641197 RepID=UPI001F3BAF7E|nr:MULTISPECIES: rod shape-determining protein MreC [unclassified Halanaerobium]
MYLLFDFNRTSIITLIFIVLILSILGFLFLNDIEISFLNWISSRIFNLFTPVLNLINKVYDQVTGYFSALFSINDLIEENRRLKKEIASIDRQKMIIQSVIRENNRLRSMLSFKEANDFEVLGAEVIGNSSTNWEKKIIINRGAEDGIRNRMPVITYNGFLVGKIDYVGSNSSHVMLVNDSEFVVGGIISREDSRAIGLIRGSVGGKKMNIMDNIAWNEDIAVGDTVVTSGLSNNYPPGLKIAEITEVTADNYGVSQKAELQLFADTVTIEEVLVITEF